MEEGSILPSLTAGEPAPQAVMAVVGAVQGWERPQEGRQGSQQLTFVYFCNSPSSMGKILEVAGLKRFPPEALRRCGSPLRSSSHGNHRLFPSPVLERCVGKGLGWARDARAVGQGPRARSQAPVCPSRSPWSLALII